TNTIFGFGEVMTAITLIMVFYTVSDARYHFRIAVAPIPISKIGFWVLGGIALGSLIIDLWFAAGWLIPSFLSDQSIWQSAFAGLFLLVVFVWIYHGFISPPIFSHQNAKSYFDILFRMMVRGADDELAMISHELSRSAESLVRLSAVEVGRREDAD